MDYRDLTSKVITTSYNFETENPVSTPTENSSPDPYPLLEKILIARKRINQTQYDRIWPGKSIIPSTSLIRVITDFKLNKEDIPVGERNQLLEYAMLTHNSELLQMACSNSKKEENLIHDEHLLKSINLAVKAVENNELTQEQLLNFLLATEKLTLNYRLRPEKRINNLVGFLFNYCNYPIYPPLIRLLFENGFDPFLKDFNGTSLCDRIISKWQNSSGEINLELLFKGNNFKEILGPSEWLLKIANHPKASIEQKEFLTKLIEMSRQKKAVIELRSLLGYSTTSDYVELYQLLESGASLDSLSTKWVTETIFKQHINVNDSDCNNFEECLNLIYEIKKNNEEWINSSKIYLAFCIAKTKYNDYDNYQVNIFKQDFLTLIKGLNFSKEHWNTKDESGKTAYDYAKDCRFEGLIKVIENITRGKSFS